MTPRDSTPAAAAPTRGPLRAAGAWLWRGLVWLVLAALIGVLGVAVLVPRLGGGTPYTILTDSMRPQYPPGTLVVVRPARTEEIRVGDVVTYQLRSGKRAVVTHRVVGQGVNALGEETFTTQGDANNTPDAAPVRPVQVRGVLWYAVPWVGHLNTWLQPGDRQRAVDLTVGALGVYMVWMFATAWRDRRRGLSERVDQRGEPDSAEDQAEVDATDEARGSVTASAAARNE